MTIRQQIIAELERRAWSAHELARRSGVAQPIISRWISETRPTITTANLEAIADALGRELRLVRPRPKKAAKKKGRKP